ncbi:MAG: GTP pyrophosphokinase [Ignavibacteria bacterium]|jgi:(p)ppGpp synthase/HD superfamily hydrolase
MLSKAIRIAAQAFEGKYDKGGNPYILHCLYVMNAVKDYGEEYMIVAVLHDLLEDTDWTAKMLLDEGFTQLQIQQILILTHHSSNTYEEYIRSIAYFDIACVVKMADLCHNSDITRLKGLTEKDFKRLEKYAKAYDYLKNIKER